MVLEDGVERSGVICPWVFPSSSDGAWGVKMAGQPFYEQGETENVPDSHVGIGT
jgi:hypothetical protein